MIFTVWQIQYSDADIEAINAEQPNAKRKAKTEMNFDFSGENIAGFADKALMDGLYTHVFVQKLLSIVFILETSVLSQRSRVSHVCLHFQSVISSLMWKAM